MSTDEPREHDHGRRRYAGRGDRGDRGRAPGGRGFTAFALLLPLDPAQPRGAHLTVAFLRSPSAEQQLRVLRVAAAMESEGLSVTFTPQGKRSPTGRSMYGSLDATLQLLRRAIDEVKPWCRAHGDSEEVGHVSDYPFGMEPVTLPLRLVAMIGSRTRGVREWLAELDGVGERTGDAAASADGSDRRGRGADEQESKDVGN